MASPTLLPATRTRSTSKLSLSAELDRREKVIRRGAVAFAELAVAFTEVYDGDLWLAKYPSFAAWCKAAWNISRTHGCRLVLAGRLVMQRRAAGLPLPAHEHQAREMRAAERNPAKLIQVQRNGTRKPRVNDGECHESANGKLVIVQVWQIQRICETADGELVPQRVSEWPTERDAEIECRRLMFGQADGKRQLAHVLETADA